MFEFTDEELNEYPIDSVLTNIETLATMVRREIVLNIAAIFEDRNDETEVMDLAVHWLAYEEDTPETPFDQPLRRHDEMQIVASFAVASGKILRKSVSMREAILAEADGATHADIKYSAECLRRLAAELDGMAE